MAILGLSGCEAPRYGRVAGESLAGGAVELWAPEGRLTTGVNRVVIALSGKLVEVVDIPPRLRFVKPVSGSGYPAEREVRLHRSGPGQFAGTVRLPEPGKWLCLLETAGETLSLEVAVE